MTLVLLLELVDFMINLTQRTYLIERQTNNTALLSDSLQNALTNPPYSIGNEFEASSLVELLRGVSVANALCASSNTIRLALSTVFSNNSGLLCFTAWSF